MEYINNSTCKFKDSSQLVSFPSLYLFRVKFFSIYLYIKYRYVKMIKEVRSFNFVYSHTRVSEVSTSGSKKGFTLCSKMRNLLQFSNLITPFSLENAVHA